MAAKCGAKTRAGHPCTRYALPGAGRCGYHSGDFEAVPGDGQPRLEDGTVDVRALVARWDADANRGAGEPRESTASTGSSVARNRKGPGDVCASPDPASTSYQEPT